MFSSRLPDLTPNRFAQALARRRAAGRPVLDLTESNPTRAGFSYPPDLLAPLAASRGLAYEPSAFGLAQARDAVAADYRRRGLDAAADRIVLTASTSEAYSLLFKLLADPGDEVLVPRPSYPLLEHLARFDGLVPMAYDLEYHGAWGIDTASVERAVSRRTRAIVVVSPNNPTGSFAKTTELDRIAALRIPIISDEVFAEYEIAAGGAVHAGGLLRREEVLSFTLGGLSKSVGLPQAKLGWAVASGPGALVRDALERLELVCDTYLSVSTPIQLAAAELLSRGAAIRSQIQARVRANHAQLLARAADRQSCRVLESEGGWYAVLRVPTLGSEEDLVLDLLERDGLLTHPGHFFDFPQESYLVVSLIVPEERFADGISRLLRHFDCTASTP